MDIKLADGTKVFLHYEQFKVASAKDKYKLTVGGFQGTTTDPMAYSNGMNFTTKDNVNDKHSDTNCATATSPSTPHGGWWHRSCWHVHPNNFYKQQWGVYLNNNWHTLPFVEMKIRPVQCNI